MRGGGTNAASRAIKSCDVFIGFTDEEVGLAAPLRSKAQRRRFKRSSLEADVPPVVELEVDDVVLEEDHAFCPAKSPVPPTILCSQRPCISSANVSSTYFAVKV